MAVVVTILMMGEAFMSISLSDPTADVPLSTQGYGPRMAR